MTDMIVNLYLFLSMETCSEFTAWNAQTVTSCCTNSGVLCELFGMERVFWLPRAHRSIDTAHKQRKPIKCKADKVHGAQWTVSTKNTADRTPLNKLGYALIFIDIFVWLIYELENRHIYIYGPNFYSLPYYLDNGHMFSQRSPRMYRNGPFLSLYVCVYIGLYTHTNVCDERKREKEHKRKRTQSPLPHRTQSECLLCYNYTLGCFVYGRGANEIGDLRVKFSSVEFFAKKKSNSNNHF